MKVDASLSQRSRRSDRSGRRLPRVILHGFEKAVRATVAHDIQSIGGTVVTGQKKFKNAFNPECTHLLLGGPLKQRALKVLCCAAGGRWILKKEYLDVCLTEGRFVDEEAYEVDSMYTEPEQLSGDIDPWVEDMASNCRTRRMEVFGAHSDVTPSQNSGCVRNIRCVGAKHLQNRF